MNIDLEWIIENRVCLMVTPKAVTAMDLQKLDHDLSQWLDEASEQLHLIADLRRLNTIPPIKSLIALNYVHHPRLGQMLTVGITNNPLARFIITSGTQIMRLNYKDFNTTEEALAYLKKKEGSED